MITDTFDIRLNQSQIDLIVNALKSLNKIDDVNDDLIDMFENVEIDVLNSFVD